MTTVSLMSHLFTRGLFAFVTALSATAASCSTPDSDRFGTADGDVSVQSESGEAVFARAVAEDSTLVAAERLLQNGHPWQATRLLAPVLRTPERRTAAAVLLAARAAAGWEGWAEVQRLLASEPWLDTEFGGAGRELLARSALERGVDTAAVTHAEAALAKAGDTHTRGVRHVLLARALDRRNVRDSASTSYSRAAEELPEAREWLLLRAAGVTADSAERAHMYAGVRGAAPRARVEWTEALAMERTGDPAGAAVRYAKLGALPTAFRLRLGLPMDTVAREQLRSEVVAFISRRSGTGDARLAVEVLDRAFPSLTPAEELVVARSANASGPVARAVAAYQRGLAAAGATPADRLAYGQLLVRVGRHREAVTELGKITAPRRVAAEAAYQRARAMLLGGNGTGARAALRAAANKFAGEAEGAAPALYLLADLATDDGRDDDARASFRELYAKYPRSARADDARFRASMIAYVRGDLKSAALELDSLATVAPRSGEAMAARYWSGLAWAGAGDSARARDRWRDAIAREPVSYYASASARRLDTAVWVPPGGPATTDTFPHVPDVDSAMRRIVLLEQLGMDVEAGFEYSALEAAANGSPARLLATANALRAHGQTSRAIRLVWKLIEGGQRDARAYRLAYPVVDREELTRQARARSLEPALVAALIRQESNFNPRAVSVAGARGLMQVMPAVGQQIARSLGYPVWDAVLLFDPDANLELGTAHLAAFMKQYDGLTRTLAAYNAGGSRVERWKGKAGTDDPEIFAERIPFTETRDYVRIVQRNKELYEALYDWK